MLAVVQKRGRGNYGSKINSGQKENGWIRKNKVSRDGQQLFRKKSCHNRSRVGRWSICGEGVRLWFSRGVGELFGLTKGVVCEVKAISSTVTE